MYCKATTLGIAAILIFGALATKADISIGFESISGQDASGNSYGGITFNGNGSSGGSFTFATPSSSQSSYWATGTGLTIASGAQWCGTGSTSSTGVGDNSSAGLSGWFTSSTWTYGAVTGNPISGETATATSVPGTKFYIEDSQGGYLSGVVNTLTLNTGTGNGTAVASISQVTYAGTISGDLTALVKEYNSSGNGSLNISFTFDSVPTLSQINGITTAINYGGTISAGVSAIPEPTTVVAGAAALGMLALLRVRRAKRQN